MNGPTRHLTVQGPMNFVDLLVPELCADAIASAAAHAARTRVASLHEPV